MSLAFTLFLLNAWLPIISCILSLIVPAKFSTFLGDYFKRFLEINYNYGNNLYFNIVSFFLFSGKVFVSLFRSKRPFRLWNPPFFWGGGCQKAGRHRWVVRISTWLLSFGRFWNDGRHLVFWDQVIAVILEGHEVSCHFKFGLRWKGIDDLDKA